MGKRTYVLALIFVLELGFLSFKSTYALFSDNATSSGNIFSAASIFPSPSVSPSSSPSSSPSGSLVINEVFVAGNSDDEWVEIFNNTLSTVDISGWSIADNSSSDLIPSSSPIPAGGYAVIVSDDDVAVPLSAIRIQLDNPIGNGFSVGNDNISLTNLSAMVVDSMNWGSDTTFFSPSIAAPANDQSLARNPNGVDTNTASDWTIDTTPTIGVSN
ncbi:lamin tail domain-containing protein [Candidatus Daviesbacteria bacterium]|nr:lamin tail domain-containing protein [Candidatus Daviesbacteria bacterium]